MKFLLLVILFSLVLYAQADMGSVYILKLEITYDKGKETGYTRVGGYFDSDTLEKRIKEGAKSFVDFLQENQAKRSLQLYRKIYSIDSLYITIGFKDQMVDIPLEKIKKVKLLGITETGFS